MTHVRIIEEKKSRVVQHTYQAGLRTPTHASTHAHAHTRTHARKHAHTHARTHARTHAHAHTHSLTPAYAKLHLKSFPEIALTIISSYISRIGFIYLLARSAGGCPHDAKYQLPQTTLFTREPFQRAQTSSTMSDYAVMACIVPTVNITHQTLLMNETFLSYSYTMISTCLKRPWTWSHDIGILIHIIIKLCIYTHVRTHAPRAHARTHASTQAHTHTHTLLWNQTSEVERTCFRSQNIFVPDIAWHRNLGDEMRLLKNVRPLIYGIFRCVEALYSVHSFTKYVCASAGVCESSFRFLSLLQLIW